MNVSELLISLTDKGVKVWVDEDKLRIHSPKNVLTLELQTALTKHKSEILTLLNKQEISHQPFSKGQALSLDGIGRLIGGFGNSVSDFTPPAIDPNLMAQQLKVTFRPLPQQYQLETILKFRENLEQKLRECGVEVLSWEQATKEFTYEISIPLTSWKHKVQTRVVRATTNAVIDVERKQASLLDKAKVWFAEKLYYLYTRFILKNRKLSVTKIAQFMSWAEDNLQPLEDPTNTQVIVLTEFNQEFVNPEIPYQQKIPIGVSTLVRTFSEIVIGVSSDRVSILNMNLSDSVYFVAEMDEFVLKSLIPKIFVPILPLPLSRFEVSEFTPNQSIYASDLVDLGRSLAPMGLLPSGFKIDDVVKRQSHRDIVDWMANGRTGVSYGFVAYIEPPQYIGPIEISEQEWKNLTPVAGFSIEELRQNKIGRRYIKTKISGSFVFKQFPDIWLVSSRSGTDKTNLNLETDVLRIGLQDRLLLQLPQGINTAAGDIKPSYDTYVMVAIALAAALFAPELVAQGAPIVHFHGYPAAQWFQPNEYYSGTNNPSVPCGTYESGVFNFLGIYNLVNQHGSNIELASLIEPDHGTNIIARSQEHLLNRLKTGILQGQVELGGKHFPSLQVSPPKRLEQLEECSQS